MKKYRLIEYDPCFSKEYHTTSKGDFNNDLEAFATMENEQKKNPNFFYRIEEVEESIMDRVKSYEDALYFFDDYGRNDLINIISELERFDNTAHIIALLKLERITKVLNEGWKPDWEDREQKKWMPIFDQDGTLIGASTCSGCSQFPSRLYFKSRELAEYAAKQFAELYKQLLIEKF